MGNKLSSIRKISRYFSDSPSGGGVFELIQAVWIDREQDAIVEGIWFLRADKGNFLQQKLLITLGEIKIITMIFETNLK